MIGISDLFPISDGFIARLLLDVAFLACGRIVLSTYSDYIGHCSTINLDGCYLHRFLFLMFLMFSKWPRKGNLGSGLQLFKFARVWLGFLSGVTILWHVLDQKMQSKQGGPHACGCI